MGKVLKSIRLTFEKVCPYSPATKILDHKLKKQAHHTEQTSTIKKYHMDQKQKSNLFIGLGLVSEAIALVHYLAPSASRPAGKWSLITGPIWDAHGPLGLSIYWAVLGATLVTFGLVSRRK